MVKVEIWSNDTVLERGDAESRCRVDEGFVFSCDFRYPKRQTRPRDLSETISASYGLERQSLRVFVAETEFYFTRNWSEAQWFLEDVNWRSNPRSWDQASLPPPPATDARFGFAFLLPADLDDDVVSLGGAEPGFVYDAARHRLRMDFAPVEGTYEIYPLSDGAAIFVDPAGELLAMSFEAIVPALD